MPITRIVFTSTTTSDLKFKDADVIYDGGMAVVWQGNVKAFALPVGSIVAVERIPDPEPAPEPAGDAS